jgi:hypothetical protein
LTVGAVKEAVCTSWVVHSYWNKAHPDATSRMREEEQRAPLLIMRETRLLLVKTGGPLGTCLLGRPRSPPSAIR